MYKVYLVDDEKYVLEELKILIDWQSFGFSLCGASTDPVGAEAEILQQRPQLVFLDINMRKMDGLTLAGRLKQQLPQLQVAFLSAYDKFDYAVSAIELGAKVYLTKPINVTKLKAFLTQLKKELPDMGIPDDAPDAAAQTDIITEIVSDIRHNYGSRLLLTPYAEKYHYSVEHLSRIFKESTGESFTAYVVGIKMQKAAELMDRGSVSLKEIACRVGYTDYYQFSKIFKKHIGLSPKEYKTRKERSEQ